MNKFLIFLLCLLSYATVLSANVVSWDPFTQTYIVDQYGASIAFFPKRERVQLFMTGKDRTITAPYKQLKRISKSKNIERMDRSRFH